MTIAITLLISSAVSFWISSRPCFLNLFDPFLLIRRLLDGSEGKMLWRSWGSASQVQISGSLSLSPAFERIGPSLPGETNLSQKCFARWKDSGGHCNGMHSHLGSWLAALLWRHTCSWRIKCAQSSQRTELTEWVVWLNEKWHHIKSSKTLS